MCLYKRCNECILFTLQLAVVQSTSFHIYIYIALHWHSQHLLYKCNEYILFTLQLAEVQSTSRLYRSSHIIAIQNDKGKARKEKGRIEEIYYF